MHARLINAMSLFNDDIKGNVSVISSDHSSTEYNARFTAVPLMLCFIKYELDTKVYNLENWLFFNFGFFTKVIFLLQEFIRNLSLVSLEKRQYLPHYWLDNGFKGRQYLPHYWLDNMVSRVDSIFHIID